MNESIDRYILHAVEDIITNTRINKEVFCTIIQGNQIKHLLYVLL